MCNENDKINMSVWTLDRIQAEQYKHMSFMVTGVIPTVASKQIENHLDALEGALDAYIRKVTEDTDMYIICEIAKLYIESQRPAEWVKNKKSVWDLATCSECEYLGIGYSTMKYCPNCGRRMKNGT